MVPPNHAASTALLLLLGACAQAKGGAPDSTGTPPDPSQESSVVFSLFLIGDAGEPLAGGTEPTFRALEADLAEAPDRSFVVFLGDNIYPAGLPEREDQGRQEAERRLEEQVSILKRSKASGVFVPGNHDWARGGPDGWAAVRRQEERLSGMGMRLLPPRGCPGPAVLDLPGPMRLILLDTQWWLHAHNRPAGGECAPEADERTVLDALTEALRVADVSPVVVAGHHPMVTYGTHGGRFPWEDHLFPLRSFCPWLLVPLPIVGSLYPIARAAGISTQDLASPVYASFVRQVDSVLSFKPPLVYAAGHEHTLQVIHGVRAYTQLVSGNGIERHDDPLGAGPGLVFGSTLPGYMRVDIAEDGTVSLSVVEVGGARPQWREAFRIQLRAPHAARDTR